MTAGRIPSIEGGIQPTIVDAKGDLIAAVAADTPARLAVGANDTILTADSSTATGLKWAAPAAPATGANWSLLNAGGTALTGAATVTVSGISGKDKILILIDSASSANASASISVRLNTDTGNNYRVFGANLTYGATYGFQDLSPVYDFSTDKIAIFGMANNAASFGAGYLLLSGCNSAGVKQFNGSGSGYNAGAGQANARMLNIGGIYNSATVISSISVVASTGNLDNGTVYVFTSA